MGIPVLNFITTYFIIKSKFSLRQSFLIFINAILPLSVFGFMHVFLITTGLSGEYVGFFFDPPMFVSVCISVVSWGAFFMDYWALCKKSA
jgi:hypothetical protein